MYRLTRTPENLVYKQLVELAFQICDSFHLVIRRDMGKTKDLKKLLFNIESSLITRKKEREWASTILDGKTAFVYYFNTKDVTTKTFIKDTVSSLYSWKQPDFPEDLSFFKNGEVWMSTSSHEKECYIYPTSQDEIKDILNIKGIELEKED